MSKILLVEDNSSIGQDIKAYLELEWLYVDWISDWKEGFDQAINTYYDLIILDVMLPWMDGFTFSKRLREKKSVPIIMTTAKWQIEDKKMWFSWWADDYLVKPFALEELLLRIQAILKRSWEKDLRIRNNITIFMDENKVIKDESEIHLTTKERNILLCLIEWAWSVISRTSITEIVWWSDNIRENDAKIDVYIANLRKKLDKSLIETVKWIWYKIDQQ